MRERDDDTRQLFGEDFAGAYFVGAVPIAVQENDRDRFNLRIAQFASRRAQFVFIERRSNAAIGEHALGYAETKPTRHDRLGHLNEEIVEVVPNLALDFEQIAEAG